MHLGHFYLSRLNVLFKPAPIPPWRRFFILLHDVVGWGILILFAVWAVTLFVPVLHHVSNWAGIPMVACMFAGRLIETCKLDKPPAPPRPPETDEEMIVRLRQAERDGRSCSNNDLSRLLKKLPD